MLWVKRIVCSLGLLLAIPAYADQDVRIRDKDISGRRVQVEKVGSSYGLLQFSGDKALQVRVAAGTADDADGNPEYVGWAEPSSKDSETEWRIIKITWDADGPTGVYFADQVDTFTKEWDERASYDYTP